MELTRHRARERRGSTAISLEGLMFRREPSIPIFENDRSTRTRPSSGKDASTARAVACGLKAYGGVLFIRRLRLASF
jgi:hypothetical protein